MSKFTNVEAWENTRHNKYEKLTQSRKGAKTILARQSLQLWEPEQRAGLSWRLCVRLKKEFIDENSATPGLKPGSACGFVCVAANSIRQGKVFT